MMDYTIITIIESIYLFYMYFLFKTKYNISTAILDKAVNKLGPFFAHKTQCYCNKVCGFGKFMAIVSIILGFVRLNYLNNPNIIMYMLGYGLTCALLAFLLNMDAFIYLIPLIMTELIIILSLYKNNKDKIKERENLKNKNYKIETIYK
jgi:hypothetical protein